MLNFIFLASVKSWLNYQTVCTDFEFGPVFLNAEVSSYTLLCSNLVSLGILGYRVYRRSDVHTDGQTDTQRDTQKYTMVVMMNCNYNYLGYHIFL